MFVLHPIMAPFGVIAVAATPEMTGADAFAHVVVVGVIV